MKFAAKARRGEVSRVAANHPRRGHVHPPSPANYGKRNPEARTLFDGAHPIEANDALMQGKCTSSAMQR